MQKRIISLVILLSMLLSVMPLSVQAAEPVEKNEDFLANFARWGRLPEDYVGIYDASDLVMMEENPYGQFILMDDITVSGDWVGLCSEEEPFQGVLDGNGYTISGLNYSFFTEESVYFYWGLFQSIDTAEVRNLRVEGSLSFTVSDDIGYSRSGCVYVGGIAGMAQDALIYNCVSNVTISDNQSVANKACRYSAYGGIVGNDIGSSLKYCRSKGNITAFDYVGGIVGNGDLTELFACLNTGNLKGIIYSGGIMGNAERDVRISSCANEGDVYARDIAGGIVAFCDDDTYILDCLNSGNISRNTQTTGFSVCAGFTTGAAAIFRSLSIGKSPYGAFHAIGGTAKYTTVDCYWLEGSTRALDFDLNYDDKDPTLGMLTAEQMKEQKHFEGFDFPNTWTLEEGMDYPYPTALLNRQLENPYKVAYVDNLLRALDEDEKCIWIFGGSGEGSLAGVLADCYEDANLHIVNQGWNGINYINKCVSFDFDIENDYDILLADLMMAAGGMKAFETIAGTEIMGYYADMITHLCNTAEGLSGLEETMKKLGSAANNTSAFSSQTQNVINDTNQFLNKQFSVADVNKAFTFLGCVTDTVNTGVESAQDIVDFFTLTNAYASAGENMAEMLTDIAAASNVVESPSNKDFLLRLAVNGFVNEMDRRVAGDYTTLFNLMGEELIDLSQTGANCIYNICSGFSDLLPAAAAYKIAGFKMGLNMGVFFGDQVTNMDDVAYYGTMMDMAGYFAKCTHKVAMDYRRNFENDPCYENAVKLTAITDLYLYTQELCCSYAFSYSMAMAEKSITDAAYEKHLNNALQVVEHQNKIHDLIENGNVVTIDPDGGIRGFVAKCPVTVIVEDADGQEIARLESGKETLTEGYADYYMVYGESMDHKAGFYGPNQSIRIIAEGEGTMDLLLFEGKGGKTTIERFYENVSLRPGDELVPDGADLVVNGEERIPPGCLGKHSWNTGVVTKEPTCEEEGEKVYTCTVCGETRTETIDKLPEVLENPFIDVFETDYFFDPVMWAVKNGVTSGLSANIFGPNEGCTRGQVVTFLWRAAGEPAPESSMNPFKDVAAGEYYYDAVLWAVENGITTGAGEGRFDPDSTCTRGQIVTFLWRSFGKQTAGIDNPFDDVSVGDYYYDAVLWAVDKGITTGVSAESFAPDATCTRGQVVTFLYRAMSEK